MLSHEKKFIFIQIPKCAGTSTAFFLKKEVNALGPKKEPGLPFRFKEEGLVRNINAFPDYFTFTFVRNPYDRFVSIWKHSVRGRKTAVQKKGKDFYYRPRKGLNMKEYAYMIQKWDEREFSRFDLYHAKTQVKFVPDYNKETFFGIPRVNQNNCGFIGKVENLQEDFKSVCSLLNIPYKKLKHKNKGKRVGHYSDYYDEETREIVQGIYAEDLKAFDYQFEKSTTPINMLSTKNWFSNPKFMTEHFFKKVKSNRSPFSEKKKDV